MACCGQKVNGFGLSNALGPEGRSQDPQNTNANFFNPGAPPVIDSTGKCIANCTPGGGGGFPIGLIFKGVAAITKFLFHPGGGSPPAGLPGAPCLSSACQEAAALQQQQNNTSGLITVGVIALVVIAILKR